MGGAMIAGPCTHGTLIACIKYQTKLSPGINLKQCCFRINDEDTLFRLFDS